MVASFASYALEKRISKTPGASVKAPSKASGPEGEQRRCGRRVHPADDPWHSAECGDGALLGAFVIHGLQPGPLLITQNFGLFWGIIASMYIGNVMLLILNLPLIGTGAVARCRTTCCFR